MRPRSVAWLPCRNALLLLSACLLGACLPSLKQTFAESSYPKEVRVVPPRDLTMSLDASVVGSLVVGFERPREVARCLHEVARKPAMLMAAEQYGRCRASGRAVANCAAHLPWLERSGERYRLTGCAAGLTSPVDRAWLLYAFAEASDALTGYSLSTRGQGSIEAPLSSEESAAFAKTVKHAARLLDRDPTPEHLAGRPVIALSGGAANGAFIAGYVRELLWLRERAWAHARPEDRPAIDELTLAAGFGSSVGTLVALSLDLYFAGLEPTAEERPALEACRARASSPTVTDPTRLVQACAMTRLELDFVRNEWELLCAEPGSVLRLLDPELPSLLRFDPLRDDIVRPAFQSYRRLLLDGAFQRVAMAADFEQNVLVGLDERACRLSGMDADTCLVTGVMASIVQPVFVPPEEHVYSGLYGPDGERGTWLDGSLRSLNPAARAAQFASGKVLVVNAQRAEGVPAHPPPSIVPLIMGTLDTMGAAQRHWEIRYAEQVHARRSAFFCQLPIEGAEPCAPGSAEPGDARVMTVWVPEDIEPAHLFASGYTFDPVVMNALFLAGQRELLRSRHRVLSFLDWCPIGDLEHPGACSATPGGAPSPAFAQEIERELSAIEQKLRENAKYAPLEVWQAHVDERRALVEDKVGLCGEGR